MLLRKIVLLTVIMSALTGCILKPNQVHVSVPNFRPAPAVKVEDPNGIIPKLVTALKNANKEDCEKLYMFYSGIRGYLEHTKKIVNTTELNPPKGVIVVIRNDYEWPKGKLPEVTALIHSELALVGIDTPQDMSVGTDVRKRLIISLKAIEEGFRQALSAK